MIIGPFFMPIKGKGITLVIFLLFVYFFNFSKSIVEINHYDKIPNSLRKRKSLKNRKNGFALLDHKYVFNAA